MFALAFCRPAKYPDYGRPYNQPRFVDCSRAKNWCWAWERPLQHPFLPIQQNSWDSPSTSTLTLPVLFCINAKTTDFDSEYLTTLTSSGDRVRSTKTQKRYPPPPTTPIPFRGKKLLIHLKAKCRTREK